jgi:hypothetical protein
MVANTEFLQFLQALGAFESGIDPSQTYSGNQLDWLRVFDPDHGGVDRHSVDLSNSQDLAGLQYHVHNTLGFLGKYQFGEPLLIDLGYYTPGANGFYGATATNEWQGAWTGKNGVTSKADFMSSVQELAIREAFAMNMSIIESRLAQAGQTLDDYLGQTYTYTRQGVQETAEVTLSGILASAHLQGPGGVANLLLNNVASSDEYGTNILFYMDRFAGFDSPFGASGDDVLAGSDYTETFDGGSGYNVIETGAGFDKIVLNENVAGVDVVVDFDPEFDAISLQKLPGIHYDDLALTQTELGVEVEFLSQKLVLSDLSLDQLNPGHFVQGVVTLGWNYNSGDTLIRHFNVHHDVLDMNYAFDLASIHLYEEHGSAVIEVVNNSQRYLLENVPLAELKAYHFIKAPIGFAEHFVSDERATTTEEGLSPVVDTPEAEEAAPPASEPAVSEADNAVVLASHRFTWDWGARQVIEHFDLSEDVVDLQSFWTDYSSIRLYDNADGHAVIDLLALNNQSIVIEAVSVDALTAANFVGVSGRYHDALSPVLEAVVSSQEDGASALNPDPVDSIPTSLPSEQVSAQTYSYSWDWGARHVIEGFDVNQDVIDLQGYWTHYQDIGLTQNAKGDAVIDLLDLNNVTITLEGVMLTELSADNIHGVQGQMSEAWDGTGSAFVGSQVTEGVAPAVDVYSYGWNWGAREVVQDFDVALDQVDLSSFWTSREQISIYDNADGHAVIDLLALNNQTITLDGVSSDALDSDSLLF